MIVMAKRPKLTLSTVKVPGIRLRMRSPETIRRAKWHPLRQYANQGGPQRPRDYVIWRRKTMFVLIEEMIADGTPPPSNDDDVSEYKTQLDSRIDELWKEKQHKKQMRASRKIPM